MNGTIGDAADRDSVGGLHGLGRRLLPVGARSWLLKRVERVTSILARPLAPFVRRIVYFTPLITGRRSRLHLGSDVNTMNTVFNCASGHIYVGDLRVVDLADGTEVASRTVVIASGARYRRLEVDDLERFEGAGVYYATSELERRACRGHDVIVVGGGNSAGQAALSLATTCSSVSLVVRRDNLEETMSHYLVARIEQDPRIRLMLSGVVRALDGDDAVTSATIENTATGERETVACRGVFCFIGAVAATDWLDGTIALDRRGFVQTGRNLPAEALDIPEFAERYPLPFETSMPGVFAAGDVRSASMKRVAAAVGEGSTVVRSIIEFIGARV